MSKTWNFDQPLDDVKSTSSHEERAKIAALFHKQDEKPIEEVDYVAAFEQQQKESESKDVQTLASTIKQSQPKKVNITSDYKQHLADTITFSLAIKLVALLLVMPGWLTLWIAIFADMGATLLVTLNSLRLLKIKE
ncbi:hypothetical protein HK261_01180 [Streptococcus agalactiae]|nr:hypothetical protein [Streptococcus agalactiae]MCC9695280.1 hypothetical protein [Streptococcus agalactiae]